MIPPLPMAYKLPRWITPILTCKAKFEAFRYYNNDCNTRKELVERLSSSFSPPLLELC